MHELTVALHPTDARGFALLGNVRALQARLDEVRRQKGELNPKP